MTIHASKGKEFKVVIFVGNQLDRWVPIGRQRYKLPGPPHSRTSAALGLGAAALSSWQPW